MNSVEFYGRTIKIDDISFFEQRETYILGFFSIVLIIFGV